MEAIENNEKKIDILLVDFPFICRICLGRGDLRLFEGEDYLLDLFVTITKIDVSSTVNFPRNICNECVNKLQDLSLFVDILRYSNARHEENLVPKKEIEYKAVEDYGTPQEHEVKTEKTTEEYDDDICSEGSEICQICSLTSCLLTPFEEKAHLMQPFQNISNIDGKAESKFPRRLMICSKCTDKLEKISLFISVSLCNDMTLKNIIGRDETVKSEDCVKENAIENDSLKCIDMKFESTSDRREVKIENNYFDESACCYESKNLHAILDIKVEDLHSTYKSVTQNYLNSETNSVEKTCENELNHLKIVPKGLEVNLEAQSVIKNNKCDGRGKSFPCKHHLKDHFHTREKPFKCDICKNSFTQRICLKRHLVLHTGEKPFNCDYCEKSFAYKHNLKDHLLTHTGEKPFKCDICKKSFTQRISLKRHQLAHTGEKSFNCDSCEKSFAQKNNLKDHLLTHTGEKPFKCVVCKRSFTQSISLKRHLLTHTGEKPFKCDGCERSFACKHNLKDHMVTHSGEKPFKCDICKKSFFHKNTLKGHLLTHSGENLFVCDICKKSFTQKNGLKRHVLSHTGEKPFKCDYCKKSFTRKYALNNHQILNNCK